MHLSADNSDVNHANIDANSGYATGLDLTVGRQYRFIASADYVHMYLPARADPGWTISSRKINLSGYRVHFGLEIPFR